MEEEVEKVNSQPTENVASEDDNSIDESDFQEETTEEVKSASEEAKEGVDSTAKDKVDDTSKSEVVENEKKQQSREENAKFAALRRKQHEQELEKAKDEAFLNGRMHESPINEFTGEKISSTDDLAIYDLMKQIKADGKNPTDTKTFLSYQNKQIEEVRKKEESKVNEEKALQQFIQSDAREFDSKHPTISRQTLMNDKDFIRFCGNRLGNRDYSLSGLYEDYTYFTGKKSANEPKTSNQVSANSGGNPITKKYWEKDVEDPKSAQKFLDEWNKEYN